MNHDLTRRTFLSATGALVVRFSLGGPRLLGQTLPGSLRRFDRLDAWIRLDAEGRVTVFTGKAELGQGIETALAQIAADELDVSIERIEMITADTARTPNEGYTAGSMSIQQSGGALRQAAAEARHVLLELAAQRLRQPLESLGVEDGTITSTGTEEALSYWSLVDGKTLDRQATGAVQPKSPAEYRYVGHPVERLDIPAKVFAEEAFVQDLRLPGMLHARVVRPPSYGAILASVAASAVEEMPGVVKVVRDGSFLGVVAEREEGAVSAMRQLARACEWRESATLPEQGELDAYLRSAVAREAVVHEQGDAGSQAVRTLEAGYHKPFVAHGSIAPSCAVAQLDGESFTVWTHSQGVFPLRSALSRVLAVPEERLRVIHLDGAGCYGHNGADDAACDAILLARALPGLPVRVQWMRQDESRWEPFGSAMSFQMKGSLNEAGKIVAWQHEIWSHPHSTRPGGQPTLLAAWSLASPVDPPRPFNIPLPSGGADRNAVPLYDFPCRVVENFIPEMPIRVSALRALGGYGNHFALESFMDELAAAAQVDPVEFRRRHLSDERGRAVLELAAESSGWNRERPANERSAEVARGRGVAFGRYKNLATYFAVVVEVAVDRRSGAIRVERATGAADAGQIVNPDGLRNQLEGGIVQSTSWTLHEEVRFDRRRITSSDWNSYPILGFEEAPEVAVHLIDRPGLPPVGAGEAAQGPTAAAIANAVFDATGVRLRRLPLTPERVLRALA